jgi:hypothetical protein
VGVAHLCQPHLAKGCFDYRFFCLVAHLCRRICATESNRRTDLTHVSPIAEALHALLGSINLEK